VRGHGQHGEGPPDHRRSQRAGEVERGCRRELPEVIFPLPAVRTRAMPVPVHAEMRGVTRIYPGTNGKAGVHALGPVDLTLRKGEFYSVIGPSGCGKSTLLDVLSGLSRPTAGEITFEDKPVDGRVPDGVGVVFQEDASFPWLNVEDNIAFGL